MWHSVLSFAHHHQTTHCPTCGNHALRQQYRLNQEVITETACPVCDYLLIRCERTGRVMDSYLPLRSLVSQA